MNKTLRAALCGAASAVVLGLTTAPSNAEQQVFKFFVNNGIATGAAGHYSGPACDRVTHGANHTANDCISFSTTSSGAGAMSEASSMGIGTNGAVAVVSTLNDAFDGYGGLTGGTIGQSGSPDAPIEPPGNLSYGGLTVTRQTDTTHGPLGIADTGPITAEFTSAGVPNAARQMATFTNNTGSTIDTIVSWENNLGSDSNTKFFAVGANNTYLISQQFCAATPPNYCTSDPTITAVFGNNDYTKNNVTLYHVDGDDNPEYAYHLVIAPGQTVIVATIVILTGDVNRGDGVDANSNGIPDTVESDIALGAAEAQLILDNPGLFFADLTALQRSEIINFNFCTTIDTSQPFFDETTCAAQANPMTFDGGVLKPTGPLTFSQAVTVNATGGTVDNTNGNVTFSGVISGAGGLTFQGTHTTILSNAEALIGPSTLVSGTLEVDGSLASSPLTVNGGTVTGTGTLGTTVVNSGGTLSPAGASIGTLAVSGNLTTAVGSTVRADVGATHDLVTVTGSLTINGGTVVALGSGTFTIGQSIALLTSTGARTGTFTSLSASGFNAAMVPTLTYDGHDVFLTLAPNSLTLPAGASTNELSTAAAVNFAVAHDNAQAFGPLFTQSGATLEVTLDQMSGESNAAIEQAAFSAGTTFTNLLINPFIDARGGMAGASGPALAYAPLTTSGTQVSLSMARGIHRRAPGSNQPDTIDMPDRASISSSAAGGHLGVWAAAYGQQSSLDGVSGIGSHQTKSSESGFAGGMDMRFDDSVVGLAFGYGHMNWSIPTITSGGKSNVTQGGAYGSTRMGDLFLSAAFSYSSFEVATHRELILAGTNRYAAKFNASGYGGRVELGDRMWQEGATSVAPYVAVNVQNFDTPAYTETTVAGSSAFAESVASKSTTNLDSELGLKVDTRGGSDDATTAHATLAWVHDYSPHSQSVVNFAAFTGTAFVVRGAPQPADAALVGIGLDTSFTPGLSLGVAFNGTFAGASHSMTGSAALSYRW